METGTKKELKEFFTEVIKALVSVIEAKDEFLKGHSQRVARNARYLAQRIALPKNEVESIYLAGLLHDIGKIKIPQEILQKPEKLTKQEMTQVKEHPMVAEKILAHISFARRILPIIRHHHERFDGKGYPDGLKDEEIPIGARILSIVDSYDAMISPRPYREALSKQKALDEIFFCADKQFDGKLIPKFMEVIESTTNIDHEIEEEKKGATIRGAIQQIVKKFKENEIELPVLPQVVQQIDAIVQDPNSTADDIAKIIEKDAAISLKILSVANSVLYRGAEKIHSVRQAVPRLGMQETQKIVTIIVNKNLYQIKEKQFEEMMQKFWRHALACAYSAKILAEKVNLDDPEKYFMMGMVHDVGKILLLQAFSNLFCNGDSSEQQINVEDLIDSIQETHTSFGGALLQRWQFPEDFICVAKSHEDPQIAPQTEKAVALIQLANLLTRKIGYSLFSTDDIDLAALEPAKHFNIDAALLDNIAQEVVKIMAESENAF